MGPEIYAVSQYCTTKERVAVLIGLYRHSGAVLWVGIHFHLICPRYIVVVTPGYPVGLDLIAGRYQQKLQHILWALAGFCRRPIVFLFRSKFSNVFRLWCKNWNVFLFWDKIPIPHFKLYSYSAARKHLIPDLTHHSIFCMWPSFTYTAGIGH